VFFILNTAFNFLSLFVCLALLKIAGRMASIASSISNSEEKPVYGKYFFSRFLTVVNLLGGSGNKYQFMVWGLFGCDCWLTPVSYFDAIDLRHRLSFIVGVIFFQPPLIVLYLHRRYHAMPQGKGEYVLSGDRSLCVLLFY